MALKSWNLASCPCKSCVDGITDLWVLSSVGTATYYYIGGDLDFKPTKVLFNGSGVPEVENIASLVQGSWGWGNQDALDTTTLYIRLSDDGNPDAKSENFVECNDALTLLSAASGLECVILSLFISNYSCKYSANIWVYHTTSDNLIRFKWVLDIEATNSPFALDSKLVLNDGDKIKIMAGIEDVAVLASGDES